MKASLFYDTIEPVINEHFWHKFTIPSRANITICVPSINNYTKLSIYEYEITVSLNKNKEFESFTGAFFALSEKIYYTNVNVFIPPEVEISTK